jgi:hypothetical protein
VTAPLPRRVDYDDALLCETHEALRLAFARYGIDGERPHGARRIPGDELGGEWPEPESGVFAVVKPDEPAIAEIRPTVDDGARRQPSVTYGHAAPTAERSSFLDTLDRTRQQQASTGEFPKSRTEGRPKYADWRGPLVSERARSTIAIRAAIAERHRLRARALRQKARTRGFTAAEIARGKLLAGLAADRPLTERQLRERRVGQWHRSRARNELAVEAVCLGCQLEKTMVVHCGACGSVREAPVRCRRHFFCVGCRSKIGEEKRAKLQKAMRALLGLAWGRRLLFRWRRGGRWSMKLFTLTAPHRPGHGIVERSNVFRRALPIFERKLREHVKQLDPSNADLMHWSRSREWEPGDDGQGHPHAHYVFFGPFLDLEMARGWWASALRSVGYDERERKGNSNFDVREARGKGAVAEVIKYVFKDIDGKGRQIAPSTFAGAYEALADQRTTQCSAGFMKLGKVDKKCVDCGATKCFHTRMVDGVRGEIRPGLSKGRPLADPQQLGVA